MKAERPNIFSYHDYQGFLVDWFAYKKANQSKFSLRGLAKQAGISSGYLSMVLSKQRPLSAAAFLKLKPFLGLNANEESFFENLLVLGTSDSHEARIGALDQMKRFTQYEKKNPKDAEVYEYLTHWYHVAIRELATLSDFQADALWVQNHLYYFVPLNEVRGALEFLLKSGYLVQNPDGSIHPPRKPLDCSGGIFRVALAKFHREIFELAVKSIDQTPSDKRNIQGHSCALSGENFEKARAIADEAIGKIRQLGENEKKADSVYHFEVALFPLTHRKGSAA